SADWRDTDTEDQQFGYAGLVIDFSGSIQIDARLELAYDTYGIRKFLTDSNHAAADLLDGLYIENKPVNNPFDANLPQVGTTHVLISGSISAGVGVGIPDLVSVTVNGGVSTSTPLDLELVDPNSDALNDTKLRASEIAWDINHAPNCIFT